MREEYEGFDEMPGAIGVGEGIECEEIDLGFMISAELI